MTCNARYNNDNYIVNYEIVLIGGDEWCCTQSGLAVGGLREVDTRYVINETILLINIFLI